MPKKRKQQRPVRSGSTQPEAKNGTTEEKYKSGFPTQENAETNRHLSRLVELVEKGLKESKWQFIIATVLALVGITITIFYGQKSIPDRIKQLRFEITSPSNLDTVGIGQAVLGNSPFPSLNHYVVVTTVRTGVAVVQQDPVSISRSAGTFRGAARFPIPDEEYSIRVLATEMALPAGTLEQAPSGAKSSVNSVTVRRVTRREEIVITAPTDGKEVGQEVDIIGKTQLPSMKHYVVVTPLRVGTPFVQDQLATIDPGSGALRARAILGAAGVGAGEQFSIYILSTTSTLQRGALQEPSDAVKSNSVTVRRTN